MVPALARLTLALVAVGAALSVLADDTLGFFESDALTFDAPRDRAAGPQADHPSPPQEATATDPLNAADGGGSPTPLQEATHPPPPPRPAGPSFPLAPSSSAAVGGERVEVLRVRELTSEEQKALAGTLRCSEPFMAEIRPTVQVKSVLAEAMGLRPDHVPQTLSWVFSRTARCFDRPAGGLGKQMDAIDDAARWSSLRGEGR